jgi:hypothetical protein
MFLLLSSPIAAFGAFSLFRWEREEGAQRRKGEDSTHFRDRF